MPSTERAPLMVRFWPKVRPSLEGCWEWTGVTRNGYGAISAGGHDGPMLYAHRVIWEQNQGAIPTGMCVLHHCDNRRCIRPDHLFLGTKADNSLDMKLKGRGRNTNKFKTHCKRGHPFDEANTRRVKFGRACIACSRMYRRGFSEATR